jgi:hypothetical protein
LGWRGKTGTKHAYPKKRPDGVSLAFVTFSSKTPIC